MPMRRENVAAALRYLQDKADLRGRLQRATSLDPQEQDLADIAVETGASLVPGVGTALAARDFERARRANDPAGMAMASMGAIPGGRLAKVLTVTEIKKPVKVKIPVDEIEHGESATPGGKLTWPGAKDLIRDYANRKTPLPPIDVVSNEVGDAVPWMVADGSHRLEAARLRGQKTIDAFVSPYDKEGLEKIRTRERK